MNQLPDSARILTVSNINNYIKSLLAYDTNLAGIYVSGEISNFKIYNSGHAYFSLKDKGGLLKCVMFANKVSELQFNPKDGVKVLVQGSISVYERDKMLVLSDEKGIVWTEFFGVAKRCKPDKYSKKIIKISKMGENND